VARKKTEANLAFGSAVREARVERGFVQEEAAARVGLDRSYFGAIERGEYNVSYLTVLKIARGLGIHPAELMERAEPRP
jgi:transcriptional regulator with XRE-family HTH domain